MGSKQFGYNLLKRVLKNLDERVAIDMEPKFLGRHLVMVISPMGKSRKVKEPQTSASSIRGKQESKSKNKESKKPATQKAQSGPRKTQR